MIDDRLEAYDIKKEFFQIRVMHVFQQLKIRTMNRSCQNQANTKI